jgi:DNA repair protein RadC
MAQTVWESSSPVALKQVSLRVRTLRRRRAPLAEPEALAKAAAKLLRFEGQEVILVFCLDANSVATAVHEAFRGTVDRCLVHAREVFRAAIVYGASRIVLAHNHPCGDASPSVADATVTSAIWEAGEILGIRLVDHVIVTPAGDWYSFLADGRLLPTGVLADAQAA